MVPGKNPHSQAPIQAGKQRHKQTRNTQGNSTTAWNNVTLCNIQAWGGCMLTQPRSSHIRKKLQAKENPGDTTKNLRALLHICRVTYAATSKHVIGGINQAAGPQYADGSQGKRRGKTILHYMIHNIQTFKYINALVFLPTMAFLLDLEEGARAGPS